MLSKIHEWLIEVNLAIIYLLTKFYFLRIVKITIIFMFDDEMIKRFRQFRKGIFTKIYINKHYVSL